MGKTFFTADTHFGHEAVLEFCNRPFDNIEEMNRKLINNINSRVKADDTLFVVGDFAFKDTREYQNRIRCNNVVYLLGNHDHNNGLKSKIKSIVLRAGGEEIFLTHNPQDTQPDFGLNLCGHVHSAWTAFEMNGSILINVGVDVWKYAPAELTEVLNLFDKSKKQITEYGKPKVSK